MVSAASTPQRWSSLPKRSLRLALLVGIAFSFTACATAAPIHGAPSLPPVSIATPTPVPTPLLGSTITLATCCTAKIPIDWTKPEVVNNGLEGVADPTNRLNVSWQIVGSAKHCPSEPAALVDGLASPTHPSGMVITAVDPLLVMGHTAVVYVTAPSNVTEHHYQFFNSDVVIGGNCVDLSGAEYGNASAANLETLLQIVASTKAFSYPPLPPTPG